MIRKPLTCPTCGDTWKRVVNENLTRLGPPMHECRACWTAFPSGAREWAALNGTSRLGYFLQNLLVIAPLAALLFLALSICYFFGLADPADTRDYLLFGCAVLLGLYALLSLWSLFTIVLSLRRTRGAPSAPATPPAAAKPHYPQGRPNPRPKDPSQHRGRPL